jgi:hypothetical protein
MWPSAIAFSYAVFSVLFKDVCGLADLFSDEISNYDFSGSQTSDSNWVSKPAADITPSQCLAPDCETSLEPNLFNLMVNEPMHHLFGPSLGPDATFPLMPCGMAELSPDATYIEATRLDNSAARSTATSTWAETPAVTLAEPPAPSRFTCPHCGRDFPTVTNKNRHQRNSCGEGSRARVSCRNNGCRKMVGPYYRDQHEKKHCKFKSISG